MSDDGEGEEGNCYEVMKLVSPAIDGDARAAAALWRQLAQDSGSANHSDIQRWVQHVAKRLVRDVIDGSQPANRKAEAARRAVGLSGQIGDAKLHQYIAEYDALIAEFPVIEEEGDSRQLSQISNDGATSSPQNWTWREHVQLAKQLIDMGMIEESPSGKEADHLKTIAKRVARIREAR